MILSGWKEIAQYAGRGVRTVQRWENFGLPVRRPAGHSRSAVAAQSDEIDTWLRNCGSALQDRPEVAVHDVVVQTTACKMTLRTSLAEQHSLIAQQVALREKLADLRHRLEAARETLLLCEAFRVA